MIPGIYLFFKEAYMTTILILIVGIFVCYYFGEMEDES